ncbi:MAG: phage antirepressor KilAC domain-containing protein, partial [Spirochaetota bacterium]
LQVDESTVKKAIQRLRGKSEVSHLFPEPKRGRAQSYLMNEKQVALLSKELKRSHNSGLSQVPELEQPTTKLERAMLVRQALLLQEQTISEMERELCQLKSEKARLEGSHGNQSFTLAAKSLKLARKDLIEWLELNSWVYRNKRGDLVAYQLRIAQGYLQHSAGEYNGHAFSQAKLTPKGLARLSEMLEVPA